MATRAIRLGSVLVASTFLVACDWFDDDDNDGNGRLSPAVRYDADQILATQVPLKTGEDAEKVLGLYGDLGYTMDVLLETGDELDSLAEGEAGTYQCDGGGQARLVLDNDDQEHWTLEECVTEIRDLAGETLTMRLSGTLDYQETSSESEEEIVAEFDIKGTLVGSGGLVVVKGAYQYSGQEDDSENTWKDETVIESLVVQIGDRFVVLSGYREVYDENDNTGVEKWTLSGKAAGTAIGGYIQVNTEPAVEEIDGSDCPSAGVITMESDGKVSLQLGGSTGSPNTAEIWGESNILATYATCDDFYAMVKDQFSRVGLDLVK